MRIALLLFALAACGNDHADGTPDASTPSDGSGSGGYAMLLSTDWTLPPSSEQYLCLRVTVHEDVWIQSIRPVSPTGTHHSVLMLVTSPTVADGLTQCSSALSNPAIYASGVGTTNLDFPAGVGLHLLAGQQLFLNLHLFNASEDPLTGTSGIEYLAAEPAAIVHEAGSVLVGAAAGPSVPVGNDVSLKFRCITPPNTTIFAVAPHMHLYGTHLSAVYTPAGGGAPTTVLDTDYQFDDQKFRMIAPLTTTGSGKYDVTCTYTNQSGSPIPFGESTTQEMCFAMTYIYPPQSGAVCGTRVQ